MNKEKVIKRGYTLKITSWENDGDNYKTKFLTVDSKKEAEKLFKICKELFVSHHNENGVGNSMDKEGFDILLEYYENNKDLFLELKDASKEEILDYFNNLGYAMMGNSEYYDFRVCESCEVTYSPEDIYLEKVTF